MEKLYETDTAYTFELLKKMNDEFSKKSIVKIIVMSAVVLAVIAILTIINTKTYIYAIVILCVWLVISIELSFKYKKSVKDSWEAQKLAQNLDVHFVFYENYVEQINKTGYSRVEYSKLYKVIENSDCFYLLLAKNQGFIIDKNNCSAELCSFIRHIKI